MDVHPDGKDLHRVRPEVRMCYHFNFVTVIRNVDALAGVFSLRIAPRDNQAIKFVRGSKEPLKYQTTTPVFVIESIFFGFLAALHLVEVFTVNSKLQVSHCLSPAAVLL